VLVTKPKPLADRFWAKVDRKGPDECWLWLGAKSRRGRGGFYGTIRREDGGYYNAHIAVWVITYGAKPEGDLDHTCRNTLCVNPAHLEDVSHRVNVLRGTAPNVILHREGRCARGHPRSEAVLRKSTGRVVYCKACRREKRREGKGVPELDH
jgi:hypothetical protein